MKPKKPAPSPQNPPALEADRSSGDGVGARKPATSDSFDALAASVCTPKGMAMMGLLPESAAARTMLEAGAHSGLKELDILSLLLKESQLPENQRIAGWERMAEAQARTLDCLFHRLVALGFANIQKEHFPTLLKLAFRAQAQSARTLETLATLRQPAVFAKQVNIGQQQVVANGVSFQGGAGTPAAATGQGTATPAAEAPEPPALDAQPGCFDAFARVPHATLVR